MLQQSRILIIGAGLGGLALAQGLKQAQVPFHIYERDTSASFRAQGYRIRISPDGAAAIRRLLPTHLWEVFEATCAEMVHGGHQIDADSAQTTEWGTRPGIRGGFPGGKAYNADRVVLRNLLLSGLEQDVSFGKRLERYETNSDGEVVAHLADGTSERGAFLVGADGIRSVVRKQLLPDYVILDTEGRAVFGKTLITKEIVEKIPEWVGHGIAVAGKGSEDRIKLFTDGMRFDRELSSKFGQKLGLEIPADYIYWVLVFRSDVVSPEEEQSLLRFSDEQSAQKAQDITVNWHELLQTVVKNQVTEAASTLAFLTASPNFVEEFAAKPAQLRSRITLIGDSGHPMPPVGGVGANAGFQDSSDLCDALIAFRDTTEAHEQEQLISSYEGKMLHRAKEFVDRSSGGAGHFFGMRPVSELKPAALWH